MLFTSVVAGCHLQGTFCVHHAWVSLVFEGCPQECQPSRTYACTDRTARPEHPFPCHVLGQTASGEQQGVPRRAEDVAKQLLAAGARVEVAVVPDKMSGAVWDCWGALRAVLLGLLQRPHTFKNPFLNT